MRLFCGHCIGDNFLSSRETAPETKYVIFQGANIAPRFTKPPLCLAPLALRASPALTRCSARLAPDIHGQCGIGCAETAESSDQRLQGHAGQAQSTQFLNSMNWCCTWCLAPPAKNPDYLINGEMFDNYAPSTSSVRNMASEIGGKVSKGKTDNGVVNLTDSSASLVDLRTQLTSYPIPGLKQVIVIDQSGSFAIIKLNGK